MTAIADRARQLIALLNPLSGAGSPVGSVVPTAPGQQYTQTGNGHVWLATGTANTDWVDLSAGGGAGVFPSFFYGDGADGPLLFTAAPRTVTDAVLTAGSNVITSATADFTDADVGLVLDDTEAQGNIPLGTRIQSVTNTTTAVMTARPSSPGTGDTVVIGGTAFVPGAYTTITIPSGVTVRPLVLGAIGAAVGGPFGLTVPLSAGQYLASVEFSIDGTVDLTGTGDAVNAGGVGQSAGALNWSGPLGGGGGAGDAGDGAFPSQYSSTGVWRQPQQLLAYLMAGGIGGPNGSGTPLNESDTVPFAGGGWAGSGDGDSASGGDGGNNGIPWLICAKSIVHGDSAVYALKGQDGGDGETGGGNTGGGGGGGDGWWLTISDTLTGSPALTGGGGAGGAGSGTGADGTAGEPGFGVHYTPSGVVIQNA